MKIPFPDFFYEQPLWDKGTAVIGIDEVGRGCLAGPVYVGAVCIEFSDEILKQELLRLGVHDSKLLSKRKRQDISKKSAMFIRSGKIKSVSACDIDTLGIVHAIELASFHAVQDILSDIKATSVTVLTDTFEIKRLSNIKHVSQVAIPQGDSKSISIALASVLAKVKRDTFMENLHDEFPCYEWCNNKGYGTNVHRQAILTHGLCQHHRKSFTRKYWLSH